jgi:hypothetical protein
MKIVPIFVEDQKEEGRWSIQLTNQLANEFDRFFDLLHDIEWRYNFFEKNYEDLTSGFFRNITIGEAVLRTLEEIDEMEDALYEYAGQGFANYGNSLQHLFKPLNNFEYSITAHQKSKARIKKGWLRLYAIRLAENCYLVSGGAIKLTQDMKREHLKIELKKLEQAKIFLKNNGIDYPEDLNTYQYE